MRKTLTKGGSQQALVPAPGAWLYWLHVSPPRLAASGQEDPGRARPLPGGDPPVTVDGVLPQPWAECQINLPPFWHQLSDLLSLVATERSRFRRSHIDQVMVPNEAGKNGHEHICESLELFAKEVIPEFRNDP